MIVANANGRVFNGRSLATAVVKVKAPTTTTAAALLNSVYVTTMSKYG